MKKYTLSDLNALPATDFVAALAAVYEHSPWVVETAADMRPFTSVKSLQAGCEAVLYGASVDSQIALIRAHPDLAAKLDELPKLTAFSQAEQAKAGFAALAPEIIQALRTALSTYRERFGHPFILCVTEHPAEDVLPILEARNRASADAERMACLFQIARIGWYRTCSILDENP